MDSTYSFNITVTMLSFTITATVAYVLVIGIGIYILFQEYTPFYSSTKVFIIIAYRVHITFAVLVFIFLKIT